jgi:hypothetical protein
MKYIFPIVFFILLTSCSKSKICSFNYKAIKMVKCGMSPDEVIALLGKPVSFKEKGHCHNIGSKLFKPEYATDSDFKNLTEVMRKLALDTSSCCEAYKDCKKRYQGYTLSYGGSSGPMWSSDLWVHFDRDGKVCGVYAKRYGFLDDELVVYSACEGNTYDEEALEKAFPL